MTVRSGSHGFTEHAERRPSSRNRERIDTGHGSFEWDDDGSSTAVAVGVADPSSFYGIERQPSLWNIEYRNARHGSSESGGAPSSDIIATPDPYGIGALTTELTVAARSLWESSLPDSLKGFWSKGRPREAKPDDARVSLPSSDSDTAGHSTKYNTKYNRSYGIPSYGIRKSLRQSFSYLWGPLASYLTSSDDVTVPVAANAKPITPRHLPIDEPPAGSRSSDGDPDQRPSKEFAIHEAAPGNDVQESGELDWLDEFNGLDESFWASYDDNIFCMTSNQQTEDNAQPQTTPEKVTGTSKTSQKRPASPEEASADTNSKHSKRQQIEGKISFACPFSKSNPLLYKDCDSVRLKRISDVKQHLRRAHLRPPHCPRCLRVFEGATCGDAEAARDDHIRKGGCDQRSGIVIDGLSDTQTKKLSAKVPAKLSDEDQWFTVWDIVFGGEKARPLTAYRHEKLAEQTESFLRYLKEHAPRKIKDLIDTEKSTTQVSVNTGDPAHAEESVNAEALIIDSSRTGSGQALQASTWDSATLLSNISKVLDSVIDDWTAGFPSRRGTTPS
ncbi:hypothetical protein F4778DRAFT_782215 [Xylariomycetidae sp. FL2044]|nr:hypothetical protein F4778DRAFT_782215 [Xylariomycetidae sp. FL2044]